MTSKGVSLLKFVGTVSLGLLTGLSYSLSAVTVPSILSLPSAASASRAFQQLASTSALRLRALTTVSTASFLLAFCLSPRSYRHPYLVYASVFALTSSLSDRIALALLGPSTNDESAREAAAARQQARRDRKAAREAARTARMEASYEVLGDIPSEEGSAGEPETEGEEEELEALNGEEVRGEVEDYLKAQRVHTGIASVGFLMAVVGVWGDGAIQGTARVIRG